MATGNILSYTGREHTYIIVDANTSLAPADRTLNNPARYSITVDGTAEPRTHQTITGALRRLIQILRARDYF